MDYFFEFLGFALALLGIVGSFVPILPGPITGWAGILVMQLSDRVTIDNAVVIGTFFLALFIFLLDYVIPVLGTKKFGGSRKGAIGAQTWYRSSYSGAFRTDFRPFCRRILWRTPSWIEPAIGAQSRLGVVPRFCFWGAAKIHYWRRFSSLPLHGVFPTGHRLDPAFKRNFLFTTFNQTTTLYLFMKL